MSFSISARLRSGVLAALLTVGAMTAALTAVAPTASAATAIAVNGTWQKFLFNGVGSAALEEPFTYTSATPTIVTVTDGYDSGDQFNVYDGATLLGTTSVPTQGSDCNAGVATCLTNPKISKGFFTLPAGSHSINIVAVLSPYGGGGAFLRVDTTILSTTTTLACTPPNAAVNQAVTCVATVTPQTGSGTPTGTVSFYVDGSATPAATVPLVNGSATWVTTFGGGVHTVTAVYNGDSNYSTSTSTTTASVSVACTQMITGVHSSLTVTTGTVCLRDATITGGISVAKGAVLDIENSTVSGSISANAPGGLRVCGATAGSITVTGATGPVVIGDPANNCPGNRVRGSILAVNNHGGVVILGNTVSGTVTVH